MAESEPSEEQVEQTSRSGAGNATRRKLSRAVKWVWGAIGIVASAFLFSVGDKVPEYIGEKLGEMWSGSSEQMDPETETKTIDMSLDLAFCQSGDLGSKFDPRGWPPDMAISLPKPVAQMRLCITHRIKAPYAQIGAALVEVSGDCLLLSDDPTRFLEANLSSPSVCRTPYMANGERRSLAAGMYLCIPGLDVNGQPPFYGGDGAPVGQCPEQALQDVRFFGDG